ncbi:MAG: BolA family protein [Acidiferrobacterales bacterium]
MTTQVTIEKKLNDRLAPVHLEVINESYMHNVPAGSESHFKVTVVSDEFEGKMLVARHRLINEILAEQLSGPVHALALHTLTPNEWFEKADKSPDSPPCHGGSKAE